MTAIARTERKELDALSKEVFGSSSRWQKLINKGYKEPLMEEKEEEVPPAKEGDEPTKRKVTVPIMKNGSVQYITKRFTLDNIKNHLLEQKRKLEEFRAQLKKLQEEEAARKKAEEEKKQAEEHTKAVHQQLSGSANKV